MTCFTHHHRAPTPPPQPSFANPFGLPPYFAHFLPAAAAAAPTATAASLHSDAESVTDSNNSDSAAGSPTVPCSSSSALDLSPKSVNVVDSAEDWSVDQVVDFVRGVEGCEEYAEVNNNLMLATTPCTRTWADRNRAEWDSLRRLVTPLPQGAFLFSRGFKSGVPSASLFLPFPSLCSAAAAPPPHPSLFVRF